MRTVKFPPMHHYIRREKYLNVENANRLAFGMFRGHWKTAPTENHAWRVKLESIIFIMV